MDLQCTRDPNSAAKEAKNTAARGGETPTAPEAGAGAGASAAKEPPMRENAIMTAIRKMAKALVLKSAIAF